MCDIATQETSDWLMVDPWEASQPEYVPTAQVLDHFEHEINNVLGGIEVADDPTQAPSSSPSPGSEDGGEDQSHDPSQQQQPRRRRRPARIALLAGADLIQTMNPSDGIWSQADLDRILGRFGAFVIERSGTDIEEALASLEQYRSNIWIIQQVVVNDISSTKVRLFLGRDMSVRYLLPESVIRYIEAEGLYAPEPAAAPSASDVAGTAAAVAKGKGKDRV